MNLGSRIALCLFAAAAAAVAGCSSDSTDDSVASSPDMLISGSFTSRGTGYYPYNNSLEGGCNDRLGHKLRTLQAYLAGRAEYVSVAMDKNLGTKYGTRLRIAELDEKYGRSIIFRIVDTGGDFTNKGRTRIDICTANQKASTDSTINGTLHIEVVPKNGFSTPRDPSGGSRCDGNGSSGAADDGNSDPTDPSTDPFDAPLDPSDPSDPPSGSSSGGSSSGGSSSGGSSSGGPATSCDAVYDGMPCGASGACNPGSIGCGFRCTGGVCTPGCTADWMCPYTCDTDTNECVQ